MKNKAISEDRKQYLRKVKAKKVVVIVTQLAIVLGFIILWEILANANVIDSFITSQPSRVWETLTNLSQNDLLKTYWDNFFRNNNWISNRDNFTVF